MKKEYIIIDDSNVMLLLHEVLLIENRITNQPLTYTSARKALQHIQSLDKEKFEILIFLDLLMPKMDGLDFLEEINKTEMNDNIFIIVITSDDKDSDRLKVLQYKQVVGYFEKPLSNTVGKEILNIPELQRFFKRKSPI